MTYIIKLNQRVILGGRQREKGEIVSIDSEDAKELGTVIQAVSKSEPLKDNWQEVAKVIKEAKVKDVGKT